VDDAFEQSAFEGVDLLGCEVVVGDRVLLR
jgi:hypothetical protein